MANPTTLLEWTSILNEGAIGASATMPTIPAGSNRLVLLVFVMYSGASTCQPPSSVTCNGATASPVVLSPSQTRVSTGYYLFLESDIAAISGGSLVSGGGSGTQKTIFIKVLGDSKQEAPINSAFGYAGTTQQISVPLARSEESLTVAFGITTLLDTQLTFTNPTRNFTAQLTSQRRVSAGSQNDTANTSNFVVAGQNFTSAVIANFRVASAFNITSVNDGNPIIPGQPYTWTTVGFSSAVNSGELDGVAIAGVSATGGTAPGYIDGQKVPRPGTRPITASNGPQTASSTGPVGVIPGYEYVALAPGFDTGPMSVVEGMGAEVGDFVVHPDYDDIDEFARPKTSTDGTRTYWLIKGSTGMAESYLVIFGNGLVTVIRSITSPGVSLSRLTTSGLTEPGI